MAKLIVLSLSLCILLFSGCFAFRDQPQQNECQLERLNALEPDNRIESEAGLIETWNPNNKQFQCAGVALSRCTLQRNGLRRPFYSNAPQEIFIQQGNGIFGMIFPGCPETFEEPQESEQGEGRGFRDSHQKVQRFREGDVIAVPTGVVFWMFNDQETEVIAISLIDTSSTNNQLDKMPRRFYLAGNQEQEFLQYYQQQQGRRGQREEQENEGGNIFSGLDSEFLQDALNVDKHIVDRLQGKNEDEEKGAIVKVKGGLSITSPPERQQRGQRGSDEEEEEEEERQPRHRRGRQEEEEEEERQPHHRGRREEEEERQEERQPRHRGREEEEERQPRHRGSRREEEEEEEEERQPRHRGREEEEEHSRHHRGHRGGSRRQRDNGLEETVCTARLRQNIGRSSSPDIYNPRAGRIKTVTSLDFPILKWLKLSAEHGSLHKNAMFVPHYNTNANSIIYALRGRAWLQVVNCTGDSVFDGELEAGRVLIVPQNFAVAAKSLSDRFQYVAFKTNERAMINRLVGATSTLNGMPVEVVAATFNLQKNEARQVKLNNPFKFLVPPREESENKAAA